MKSDFGWGYAVVNTGGRSTNYGNGHLRCDRWLLTLDSDIDRVFVRHEPNLPSGGHSPISRSEPSLSRLAAG